MREWRVVEMVAPRAITSVDRCSAYEE